MAFWSDEFMNDRRKQFLNALVKFQYQINGIWHDAVINDKRIEGQTVVVIGGFPRTANEKQTITAVRIIDVTGKQCGYQEIKVVRAINQGVLVKYEFPIYEKEVEE